MPENSPPNAEDVTKMVETRLTAIQEQGGPKESVSVEWRGGQLPIPVISMPVDVLTYNPGTHRVRAQRSLDPVRDKVLGVDPYGDEAQKYLHDLLMGDPMDPSRTDPAFETLKEDLEQYDQTEPGIITRSGVLINGNTRRAALVELGKQHIRVGVLPPDASFEDQQTVELSLQLRRDLKRDYSFMNFLLAIDERVEAGWPQEKIQSDFHIKSKTFERNRWILEAVRDLIDRSRVEGPNGETFSLRLVDFENDQGKLEELHRSYENRRKTSIEEAEALKEQRLLAIALSKSKTDVRLIEADFVEKYMPAAIASGDGEDSAGSTVKIPGLDLTAAGPSKQVLKLKTLTDDVLKARAVLVADGGVPPDLVKESTDSISQITDELNEGLTQAGKTNRIQKRKLAPVDRLSDANEDLRLSVSAVSEARSTGNFDPLELDEALLELKAHLGKLANLATRGDNPDAEGISWLRAIAGVSVGESD